MAPRADPSRPTEFSSAVTAITSAFGDPTRREIYLFAHERADGRDRGARWPSASTSTPTWPATTSTSSPPAATSRSPSTARGRGGAGRPSKRYRRRRARSIALDVPVRHDDVLVTLLGRALALLPPAQAEAMAEEVGIEYGRTMAAAMGDAGDEPALVPHRAARRGRRPHRPRLRRPRREARRRAAHRVRALPVRRRRRSSTR